MSSFLATAAVGLLAIGFTAWECGSTRAMRAGRAVIGNSTRGGVGITPGRSGRVIADATLMTDRGPVDAVIRAWYCRLVPGQVVDVLDRPDDPGDLRLDRSRQCHHASTIALVSFAVVSATESARALRRRSPAMREIPPAVAPEEWI